MANYIRQTGSKRAGLYLALTGIALLFSGITWAQILCIDAMTGRAGRLYNWGCFQMPEQGTGCEPGCCCIINCYSPPCTPLPTLVQGCVSDGIPCYYASLVYCDGSICA